MTSLTRGPKSHSRKSLSKEQIRALMAMRRRGMTCEAVSKALGIGESTVARYSSAWWQKDGSKKFQRSGGKPMKINSPKPKEKPKAIEANQELTSEQISYINGIYRSGNLNTGTFIGNLFIRLGKFFGGHHSV